LTHCKACLFQKKQNLTDPTIIDRDDNTAAIQEGQNNKRQMRIMMMMMMMMMMMLMMMITMNLNMATILCQSTWLEINACPPESWTKTQQKNIGFRSHK